MPHDTVCNHVPAADLYIDDAGYHLAASWEDELSGILKVAGEDARINVALDSLWDGTEPRVGAVGALQWLGRKGCEIVISAGPELVNDPTGLDVPEQATRNLREQLRSSGLTFARVDSQKIPSKLYVSRRHVVFAGDWAATLREIQARLPD